MEDFSKFNLVGRAPAFLRVLRLIEKFSACDAAVLVQGETGTGKELAARAIHYLGARRSHPFIPVNCGALPDSLVENELFGHVRGAFTDAREAQSGLIAHAEGGTLFLDEVEALSHKAQVVLLRFLQDQVYRPLGGRSQISGNVRIIAASNVNIAELVGSQGFRQDLFYRLAILSLTMPTLRDRPGDLRVLALHFSRRFAHQYGRAECDLDHASIELLTNHDWPGNVRELENLIHREFLMTDDAVLHLESHSLQTGPGHTASSSAPGVEMALDLGFQHAKAAVIANFERSFLSRAMSESHGNVSAAARIVGKERRAMGKLLSKYNIDRTAFE